MLNGHERHGVTQHPRSNCYFCGSEGPIETHHIVPRRHGGGESEQNLVDVCPTCHQRLERLYDNRFFDEIGVESESDADDAGGVKEQREKRTIVQNVIESHEEDTGEPAPIDTVVELAAESDVFENEEEVHDELEQLRKLGEVYEPVHGSVSSP